MLSSLLISFILLIGSSIPAHTHAHNMPSYYRVCEKHGNSGCEIDPPLSPLISFQYRMCAWRGGEEGLSVVFKEIDGLESAHSRERRKQERERERKRERERECVCVRLCVSASLIYCFIMLIIILLLSIGLLSVSLSSLSYHSNTNWCL